MKNISAQQASSNPALEQHLTKIILDNTLMTDKDEKDVAEAARVVWAEHYGDARVHLR